ncbi:MAG: YidC/Oxa1 family membrane protein insertase [Candidatus Dormibacteraeota bacterium]|nr:YidC/Oxa1 family membrane protein insertase [Candidatus Dormibacteraeota bacterium]
MTAAAAAAPCRGATDIIELSSAPLGGLFNVFLPIHQLWWAVLGVPISWGLSVVYNFFDGIPILNAIGAYGLAIIVVTVVIKLILSPLYEYQIRTGRKTMLQQRALAPELAELRKKHKGDPQRLNQATMELYRERGINPLSSMSGCLPALIQLPILSVLYWVFRDARQDAHVIKDNFLFIPHLNVFPSEVPLIHGLPIPHPIYLVLPLLAAVTTYIQSRMMQQPKNPVASEQEQQTATMMKSMQYLMPVMIFIFSIQVPAGLALYWFISNCVAIAQQYRVNGWGGLRPKQQVAAFEKALQEAGYGPGPRSSATGDKIVAKRSSAERALSVPAASGAGAGTVGRPGSGSGSGSGNRNQGRSGAGNRNSSRNGGGGSGPANTSGNGKGGSRPSVAVPSGGQGARSQSSRANRRASSKRTRKPK